MFKIDEEKWPHEVQIRNIYRSTKNHLLYTVIAKYDESSCMGHKTGVILQEMNSLKIFYISEDKMLPFPEENKLYLRPNIETKYPFEYYGEDLSSNEADFI